MTSKNETSKRKGRKKVTVTVMLLERFQESVPKAAARRKLEEEKKVKKLFVSRTDSYEDLDKCICWVFGIHDYTFLECINNGHKLVVSSNQQMDGQDAIQRRGCLYICKSAAKVAIKYRVIILCNCINKH